tara:strand:+ start:285 stop:1415 length:1131 start_codon:yes stop_codon:yes gene_type:complete
MKNKGHKSSNIFQTLKSAGAWQTKDGSKPIIKNVGNFSEKRGGSPLNLNQTAGKHYLSKGSEGDSPLNLGLGTLAAGYGTYKAGQAVYNKGKELVGKAKQAYADYKAGKAARENTDLNKKEKPGTKVEAKKTSKMAAVGSEERRKQYDEKGWKYDDTIKGYNRDGSKKEEPKKEEPAKTEEPKKEQPAKTETKTGAEKLAEAKANKAAAKDAAKAARKDNRASKKADRIANRAAKKDARLASRAEKINSKIEKRSAMAMKKSPAKMSKMSPAKKALVGKQKNLPEELKQKILASPGKMKKGAAMKLKDKNYKPGKKVKTGGSVSAKRAAKLVAKGKGRMTYKVGGIGPDNKPGGKNNPGQLMKIKKKSVKIKNIKK